MVGRTLSHYKILSEISRGGMGIVYRAVDVKLDLKIVPRSLPASTALHCNLDREQVEEEKGKLGMA